VALQLGIHLPKKRPHHSAYIVPTILYKELHASAAEIQV